MQVSEKNQSARLAEAEHEIMNRLEASTFLTLEMIRHQSHCPEDLLTAGLQDLISQGLVSVITDTGYFRVREYYSLSGYQPSGEEIN